MDFKRNYCSNIQPPTQIKATHLVNPLAALPNASTPVRTRVVKPGSQLNSTPVNVHKIGIPIKSPTATNKQNNPDNGKFNTKKPKVTQQNLNLSPIMALNRKMSEGPNLEQRSFTPNGLRKQQSLANIIQRIDNGNGKGQNIFSQTLYDSRNSNSFKNMLQSRAKTPTRVAFGDIFQKQTSLGLKSSGSAHSLLQGIGTNKLKESRNSKLSQSRSFEQLINLGNPMIKQDQVLCSNSNEHEKKVKAKYKVVQQPEDQEILVYCSKCAINLVQKGFKVEDLTSEDINRIKSYQQKGFKMHQNSNQYMDYANQTSRKIHIKLNQLQMQKKSLISAYQKELDEVDCYYNSLITLIQQQKNKDRQTILKNRQKERVAGDTLQKKLSQGLNQLNHLIRGGCIGSDQLSFIQDNQSLLTQKGFGYRFDGTKCLIDNIQDKFNVFSQIFQSQGRLRIQCQDKEDRSVQPTQYFSNKQVRQRNQCPLRFSFQKNMKEAKKHPFGFRVGIMNPLQEAPEAMQGEDSDEKIFQNNEKKAFRTLFPEDQEQYIEENGQKQGIHSPTFKQI